MGVEERGRVVRISHLAHDLNLSGSIPFPAIQEEEQLQTTRTKYTTRAIYDRNAGRIILGYLPRWVCENDRVSVEITLLERREIGCCKEDGTDFKPCNRCGIMPGAPACENRRGEEKRERAYHFRPGTEVSETETHNSCGGVWK